MNDLITVIIPGYKGAKYLAKAIEGIQKQNMNVEILLIDDCSPDNMADIAKSLGARVIKHPHNMGQVAGRNTGVQEAKGQYIIFNDQDDVMREGTLSRLYDELNSDYTISAVMAKLQDFQSDDSLTKSEIRSEPYYGLLSGAVLFRKSMFDIIQPFKSDAHLDAGEMIMLDTQMKEHNLLMKKLDFIATDRRIHDNNFGRTGQKKEFQDYASLLRAKLKK